MDLSTWNTYEKKNIEDCPACVSNWIWDHQLILRNAFVATKITAHQKEPSIYFAAMVRICLFVRLQKKNSLSLSISLGIPLMGTLPHFFKAEQLLENVESGVNPEYEKHATFSVFEIVNTYNFCIIFSSIHIMSLSSS